MSTIARLAVTPVKGTRMSLRETLTLDAGGVREDRQFHLIDERGRMINGKQEGALSAICADYDAERGELRITFANGEQVSGKVQLGETLETSFYSRPTAARLVLGPFTQALCEHLARPLRLVRAERESGGVDRGKGGGVSIVGQASIARLAEQAGEQEIDARRFRMLIELSGLAAHEEDGWVGRRLAVGEALIAVRGHVGRCLVTSRDPDTGVRDLPTLELLAAYRREAATTEPLALGVYGEVLSAATIRIGDQVTLL